MTAITVRNLLVAAAIATAATVVATSSPAYAVPVPGPNDSISFTYYSSSAKTAVVGAWIYGSCLEDFEWGTRTSYFTWKRITCNPAN